MSIIERLRQMQEEIERLRALNEQLTERGMEVDAWCNQLRAEIERLQKEWVRLYAVERMRFDAVQKMTTEIERLQTENARLKAALADVAGTNHYRMQEEIERLQTLVRKLEEELESRLVGTVWLDGAVEKDGDA